MQPQKGKFSTAHYFNTLHGFEFGLGFYKIQCIFFCVCWLLLRFFYAFDTLILLL